MIKAPHTIIAALLTITLAGCATTSENEVTKTEPIQVIFLHKMNKENCFIRYISGSPVDQVCSNGKIVSYNPEPVLAYSTGVELPDYVVALFLAANKSYENDTLSKQKIHLTKQETNNSNAKYQGATTKEPDRVNITQSGFVEQEYAAYSSTLSQTESYADLQLPLR